MKLNIVGASNFVNRMFEACGNYQWAREFLKNSLEAGATRIEFGIEWQAVKTQAAYRRTIIDNGAGMSRDELRRFFSTLGEGAKRIGGVHDNFGVGAKIAALPWNPDGVVVISYKDSKASMIWIVLDPDSGDYELKEFAVDGSSSCVIDPTEIAWPDIDWSILRPDWITDRGTIIVLLGSEDQPDTVLGNPLAGERDIKGLSVYLNTRFWDLTHVDVRVVELRTEKKNSWPLGPAESDARRPNNRRIHGARYYLTDITSTSGRLKESGDFLLDDERVRVEWYLWEGERPAIHSYAKKGGYIAVRYNGELFHLTSLKVHFRWFGIIESLIQQNATIVLEPAHYDPGAVRWGIHPDQSRNRLIFTGDGVKGAELPISEWGLEFAENMPTAIDAAIKQVRGNISATIEDEEYRKRLQDKFGSRWTIRTLVKAPSRDPRTTLGTLTDHTTDTLEPSPGSGGRGSGPGGGRPHGDGDGDRNSRGPLGDEGPGEGDDGEGYDGTGAGGGGPQDEEPEKLRPRGRTRNRKTRMVLERKGSAGGPDALVERDIPVDVPHIRFANKDDFEQPYHMALWAPNDPAGPTVYINNDSPILQDAVRYHQDQYPTVYSEEIDKLVRQTFGEVAACKIAHSQKLSREIPIEELDRMYRSEQSLTISLMGLIAEESLIAQRLARFGRKKGA